MRVGSPRCISCLVVLVLQERDLAMTSSPSSFGAPAAWIHSGQSRLAAYLVTARCWQGIPVSPGTAGKVCGARRRCFHAGSRRNY